MIFAKTVQHRHHRQPVHLQRVAGQFGGSCKQFASHHLSVAPLPATAWQVLPGGGGGDGGGGGGGAGDGDGGGGGGGDGGGGGKFDMALANGLFGYRMTSPHRAHDST